MCYRLKQKELDDIPNWTNERLLDQVEYFGDYMTVIARQHVSEIPNKSDSDPDVVKMKSDYKAVKNELNTRLKNQAEKDLLAEVEGGSNQIALITASGALGIPVHDKASSQVASIKTKYESNRKSLITALGT